MNSLAITPADFDFSLLLKTGGAGNARAAGADAAGFATSLKVHLAEIQSQTFDLLLGATAGDPKKKNAGLDALLGKPAEDAAAGGSGLSASGRNMSLFDPEAAYGMMTDINRRDVTYKAQFAELSEMKSYLGTMREGALALADAVANADDAGIKSRLEAFAATYNDWITRFDAQLREGGLLADTQAAQVAQWELEVAVGNRFNGAVSGVRGMRELGLSIDDATNLASFDGARLDAVLAGNRAGAVAAVREFAADLARAAELLNSENNFMLRQLGNLDRVIDYIADNRASLQAEFGLGDPARPSGQVARALASYQQVYAMQG
jgi:hypothetical protein